MNFTFFCCFQVKMSLERPTEEMIQKAEEEMEEYYNVASTWDDAIYIGNEVGQEKVLPNVQEAFDSVHKELTKR